jgi:hypothetical protein
LTEVRPPCVKLRGNSRQVHYRPESKFMRYLILVCLMLFSATICATTTYTLDLADSGLTSRVAAGAEIELKVINRILSSSYTISVEKAGLLTPFDLTLFEDDSESGLQPALASCVAAVDALKNITDESELRREFAVQRASRPDCTKQIGTFEKATTLYFDEKYTLQEGQRLEVSISRRKDGGGTKTWRFVFTTTQGRQWLVHYGFAYVPDRDESFFTEAKTDGTGYTVNQAANRTDLQFEPTIAFSYVPKGQLDKMAIPKFTAGLGLNIFDEPLIFAGTSWIIGDNVSIFAGAAVHRQSRLAGQYEVGQMVGESLTTEQLTEQTFGVNGIIGLGFRFGQNPFKGRNAELSSASAAGLTVPSAAAGDATVEGASDTVEDGAGADGDSAEALPGSQGTGS